MKFGLYATFQCPPWKSPADVIATELEHIELAEALDFHSVWVPEQHFFDYCICPDALEMVGHLLARTRRVRVGAAVVNLSLTHPLRFAERVSLLDHLGGGRVDVCVGRGYQWPQNVVFGMEEEHTKAHFEEALDIVLGAWATEPKGHRGDYFDFPPIRIWPGPIRPAGEVLLHAIGGTTPLERVVDRGLPLALAVPFRPLEDAAAMFARYVALVEASELDTDTMLDRSIVVLYGLLAPSRTEALEIARRPFEWHLGRLAKLNVSGGPTPPWDALYDHEDSPTVSDADWAERTDRMLVFEDVRGCVEKIDLLREAGVRHVVMWMGVGGVEGRHVKRSIELFAAQVIPHFS